MPSKKVTLTNKLGLHARAAARLVQEASSFESDINIRFADKEISGKSIMGVMMLAAAHGSTIEIIANGRDEEEALERLEKLVLDKFGEEK